MMVRMRKKRRMRKKEEEEQEAGDHSSNKLIIEISQILKYKPQLIFLINVIKFIKLILV